MKPRAGFGHKLQKNTYFTLNPNLDFGEFVRYFKGPNSEALKKALFGTPNLPELISRKIWVGGNSN